MATILDLDNHYDTNNGDEHRKLIKIPEYRKNIITKIYCRRNQITEIPLGFISLKELSCSGNQLTEIPKLHKLEFLDCGYNIICKIHGGPNLKVIYSDHNLLTEIPMCPSLEVISCM